MLNKLIIAIVVLVIIATGHWYWKNQNQPAPIKDTTALSKVEAELVAPISRVKERVTKKPFGIKITPQTSPVQPEKFAGYHTGTDFETFPEEQGKEVPILAICEGKLLLKKKAAGYGGVAVQSCAIKGESVVVVYGHLALVSIKQKVGDSLAVGEQIGILGESGPDTDRERKHLHLGIHKGAAIDIRGYVQTRSELSKWVDFQK